MKRLSRLAILLTAFVVTIGLMAGVGVLAKAPGVFSPQAVHAFDGACGWPFDSDGLYNNDGYWPTHTFVTGGDGAQHQLNIDLAAFRLTESGDCFRGFYVSTWFSNHNDYGYQQPYVNAFTYYPSGSLRGPWTFTIGPNWTWGQPVWTSQTSGSGGPQCITCGTWGPWGSYTVQTQIPNGQWVQMDYGISTGYGRRAHTTSSHVYDGCVGGCNFDITSPASGFWVGVDG